MSNSTRFDLPFIFPGQAQKHVTYNEALNKLDAIINSFAKSVIAAPPATAEEGDTYIITENPEGDWSDRATQVAIFQDARWVFFKPVKGWRIWVNDTKETLLWDGIAWRILSASQDPSNIVQFGINATADDHNRLSLNSNASLFNHNGSDHRLNINKNASENTASIVFQNGFSGRAEFGLSANDILTLRQSNDGAEWHDTLSWPRGLGVTRFHGLDASQIPEAQADLSGAVVFVQSGLELAELIYCDGEIWRRVRDGAPVLALGSTLDPNAAGSFAVLTESNTVLSNSRASGWTSAKGQTYKQSGRFYFEVIMHRFASPEYMLVGLCDSTTGAEALNTHPGNFNISVALRPTGMFSRGVTVNTTPSQFAVSENGRMMIAVDIDTGHVWFGYDGIWLDGDPNLSAPSPHVTFPAATALIPLLGAFGNSVALRLITRDSQFSFAIPDGFEGWN